MKAAKFTFSTLVLLTAGTNAIAAPVDAAQKSALRPLYNPAYVNSEPVSRPELALRKSAVTVETARLQTEELRKTSMEDILKIIARTESYFSSDRPRGRVTFPMQRTQLIPAVAGGDEQQAAGAGLIDVIERIEAPRENEGPEVLSTPLPAAAPLLLMGLVGLFASARRKRA